MSRQFANGATPIVAEGPFVYRPATPWLAAQLDPFLNRIVPDWLARASEDASGLKGVLPFYAINISATLGAVMLLLAYLRLFVGSAGVRLLLVAWWVVSWQAPARYVYFNPVNIEALFLALLLAGLLMIEGTRHRTAAHAAVMVAPVVALATLNRESGLLLGMVFLAARHPVALLKQRDWHALAWLLVPVALGLAALAWTRQVGVASNAYAVWAEPLSMLRTKLPHTWVLAWFFAFGPAAIALIASATGAVRQCLGERRHLAAYLVMVGVLAYVGGTDTERILGWVAPVVLVLVGVALESRADQLRRAPALVAALVAVQLVSARLLWPVPVGVDEVVRTADLDLGWRSIAAVLDKFWVIDNYYANLWTYFGSRPIHALILAFDVTFVIVVARILNRR